MTVFDFLIWMWFAASLGMLGDGLSARAKRRWAVELGNVLFMASFAMLVIAIVAIEKFAREGLL